VRRRNGITINRHTAEKLLETIKLGGSGPSSSRLAYGCMRLGGIGSDSKRGLRALQAAVDAGFTLFDHADIYGGGQCEELFGQFIKASPRLRDSLTVLTKCGIRRAGEPADSSPGRYDFSADYLHRCVDASLRRLQVERIDVLLLHRPDYLADYDEVARVFAELHASGKVAHFGASNFSPSQFSLLQSKTSHKLVVNQVEINLHNTEALSNGVLDQCQQLGVSPQAWSPLAGSAYPARHANAPAPQLEAELRQQAERHGCEPWHIAIAWLLRHPAGISPVIGTTTPERIAASVTALDIHYSREDWYRLLEARNGQPVP
jgi:predicted oxidoreductase